jgi:hypothetical protein
MSPLRVISNLLNNLSQLITFEIRNFTFRCTGVLHSSDSDDLRERLSKVENKKILMGEHDTAAQVQKLAEQMRFRLKEAMAQQGNSEAFLHWLRSSEGKNA